MSVWLYAGCTTETESEESYPTVISGLIKDHSGSAVKNAKVSLSTASEVPAVFSSDYGAFQLTGFPSAQHTIKVEKYGYATVTAVVPRPVNGVSTVNPILQPTSYSAPAVKPLSEGPVRIRGKILETDFDRDGLYEEFVVKGAAFSPAPIGGGPWTQAVYDRSILWLKSLNANTVRTYSGVDPYFLKEAANNGIRVIVGYWVSLDADLSLIEERKKIVDDFAAMVYSLKEYPGILMWNLGNEQNYSSARNNGNSKYWYSLAQELALTAFYIEGPSYHPVCINNGDTMNIGNSFMNAHDTSISFVDLWASNAYKKDFAPFFSTYRSKTSKPIVITEFGIDALNNVTKTEHEAVQAYFDSTNWLQLRAANDVCVGATVFEFTDEWWKAGDPMSHDYGGYATSMHPDGYSNEEWWGIIAVTPDENNDGLDEWRARKAYTMFQTMWK